MTIEKDLRLIKTILRYCEKIVDVMKLEKFKKEEHKYDLISFYIFQIGETVKKISDNFISSNKEIERNKIKGMRNIIAHNYGTVKVEYLDEVVNKNIVVLKSFCLKIIEGDRKK